MIHPKTGVKPVPKKISSNEVYENPSRSIVILVSLPMRPDYQNQNGGYREKRYTKLFKINNFGPL